MFFVPNLTAFTPRQQHPRPVDAQLERFVSSAFADARRSVNVEQCDTRWTLSLYVPGLSRDDLSIGIEGAVVRIKSNVKLENGVLTP